jgi:uncharacterized protein
MRQTRFRTPRRAGAVICAAIMIAACGDTVGDDEAESGASTSVASQSPGATTATTSAEPTTDSDTTEADTATASESDTASESETATASETGSTAPTTASPDGAGAAASGACATSPPAERPEGRLRLVIGTGGTGGVFFPYGGGVARMMGEYMNDVEATAEVTGGSVDNANLLGAGDLDFGFTTIDSAFDAINGAGAYTQAIDLCAVANLYTSFVHVVASSSSGITTVEGLQGARVSVGSAGSSTEIAADRILTAAGLDPAADISRQNLSVAESVDAMKDGQVDAFFWIGGLPTAAVTDLTVTDSSVVFLDAGQYVDALQAEYGTVYESLELPAGVYEGVDEPVPGIGIGNLLVTRPDVSTAVVVEFLEMMFANLDEVQAIHPEAATFSLEQATEQGPIPYHAGAIEYFATQGVDVAASGGG